MVATTVLVLQKVLEKETKEMRAMFIDRLSEEAQLMDVLVDVVRCLNNRVELGQSGSANEEALSPVHRRPRDSRSEQNGDGEYTKTMQQLMQFVVFLARQRSTALSIERMAEFQREFV